uniref:Uncharacterized protein n=1 Tax=Arundo donax TaxID=35708 RepID=A0A0A9AYH3_ARUDO
MPARLEAEEACERLRRRGLRWRSGSAYTGQA